MDNEYKELIEETKKRLEFRLKVIENDTKIAVLLEERIKLYEQLLKES